jgi:hypothetical protein
MLSLLIITVIMFLVAIVRMALWCRQNKDFREDDRVEIAYQMVGCVMYLGTLGAAFTFESWRFEGGSLIGPALMAYPLYQAALVYHRVDCLRRGRNRRGGQRRQPIER